MSPPAPLAPWVLGPPARLVPSLALQPVTWSANAAIAISIERFMI